MPWLIELKTRGSDRDDGAAAPTPLVSGLVSGGCVPCCGGGPWSADTGVEATDGGDAAIAICMMADVRTK